MKLLPILLWPSGIRPYIIIIIGLKLHNVGSQQTTQHYPYIHVCTVSSLQNIAQCSGPVTRNLKLETYILDNPVLLVDFEQIDYEYGPQVY
jgi:hypothetical protein